MRRPLAKARSAAIKRNISPWNATTLHLTRFQLLRMLYQPPQESNAPQSYVQANTSSQLSGSALVIPPVVCSPDIPNQLVDYLQLTPREIQALQAQVSEECSQVQPLVDQLEKSRRKLMSMKLDGKADDKQVQAAAAEQSQIIKQVIVMNSQLETKLYSMLTKEQQQKVDELLRQTLNSGEKLTAAPIATALNHSGPLVLGRIVVRWFVNQGGINNAAPLDLLSFSAFDPLCLPLAPWRSLLCPT